MRKPGERRVERQGKYIFIVNEVDKDPGESVACGASNTAARVADYATWLHLSHRPSPQPACYPGPPTSLLHLVSYAFATQLH